MTRFGIRSLLFLVTLSAAAAAVYAANARQRRAEEAAIEALDKLNDSGWIVEESTMCMNGVIGYVGTDPIVPEWINEPLEYFGCGAFRRVRRIHLIGFRYDDRIVEPLKTFRGLQEISLYDTNVSEEGVRRLRREFNGATIDIIIN